MDNTLQISLKNFRLANSSRIVADTRSLLRSCTYIIAHVYTIVTQPPYSIRCTIIYRRALHSAMINR